MPNELTVVSGDRAIARNGSINYDLLDKVASAYKEQQAKSDRPVIPGTLLVFKKGKFLIKGDIKKDIAKVHKGASFIADMANLTYAWRKWNDALDKEGKPTGKRYPEHAAVAYPLSAEELPDRDTLGDLDEAEWGEYNGKPDDPWKVVVCLPLYLNDPDGDDDGLLYRLEMDTVTCRNRVNRLIGDFATEARMIGQGLLPLIELDSEMIQSGSNMWDGPVFDILDEEWVEDEELQELRDKAIADAEAEAEARKAEEAAEEDEPTPKKTRGRAKASGGKGSAKKAASTRKAKAPEPEVEADTDEDDDDGDADIVTRGGDEAPASATAARSSRRRMGRRAVN